MNQTKPHCTEFPSPQCDLHTHSIFSDGTYSPTEIRLQVGGRRLSVLGCGLYCASFAAGTVRVEGCVSGVHWLGEEACGC